ncbi:hypothetical protein OY671_008914, partial [Metschnikowia pulcherrima]
MKPRRVGAMFTAAAEAAGVTATFHASRHTFAAAMSRFSQREARANPELNPLLALQVSLGHADSATTAVYSRVVETDLSAIETSDYRVEPSPKPSIGNPGALSVNVVDADGQLECAFDFSIFDRPTMAAEWALAFRHHYAAKQPANRGSAFRTLKFWFALLAAYDSPILATRDVASGILNAFLVWLGTMPWSKGSRYTVWSLIKHRLAWLKRNPPD